MLQLPNDVRSAGHRLGAALFYPHLPDTQCRIQGEDVRRLRTLSELVTLRHQTHIAFEALGPYRFLASARCGISLEQRRQPVNTSGVSALMKSALKRTGKPLQWSPDRRDESDDKFRSLGVIQILGSATACR
jgi:hypothetical protein